MTRLCALEPSRRKSLLLAISFSILQEFPDKNETLGKRTLLLAISNTRGVIAHRALRLLQPGPFFGCGGRKGTHSDLQTNSPDFNFVENAFSIGKSHTRKFDASRAPRRMIRKR
jgi:hypothetical protein